MSENVDDDEEGEKWFFERGMRVKRERELRERERKTKRKER